MRKNNKGFTLIEMLIVVAIIAILVAVSIPLVNNSLERTRRATDAANERAAKAEAVIMYLNGDWSDSTPFYDATDGKFVSALPAGHTGYGKCSDHENGYIRVALDDDGTVTELKWENCSSETAHNGTVAD